MDNNVVASYTRIIVYVHTVSMQRIKQSNVEKLCLISEKNVPLVFFDGILKSVELVFMFHTTYV